MGRNPQRNNQIPKKGKTAYSILDALADKKILVKAFQLPIINRELLNTPLKKNTDLSELFVLTKHDLKNRIEGILMPMIMTAEENINS